MDGYTPEALTDTERAVGLILACRARPSTDVEVAWLGAEPEVACPVRRRRATVVAKEAATHNITCLSVAIKGAPLAFVAGQFAQLMFRGLPPRPYSIANRPGASTIEFHIRRIPNGVVSNYVADTVQIGDTLKLQAPYGTAYLRHTHDGPLLLVAGGSGLAPIQSILLTALSAPRPRPVYLYHGVRDTGDLYGVDLLSTLATQPQVSYTPVLSMPSQATPYRTGFVHEVIAADFPTLEGYAVYLGGPPPLVDAVTDVVVGLGAQRDHVYADPFYAAPAASPNKKGLLGTLLGSLGTTVAGARWRRV